MSIHLSLPMLNKADSLLFNNIFLWLHAILAYNAIAYFDF
jgi:hypothetical protein